jgi:transposase
MTRPEDLSLAHETLGAVPLINRFLDRLHLDQALEEAIPSSSLVDLPYARVLGIFLRNFILDRGPVYALEERVAPFAPELFRLAPEEVRFLNDDRAGRALDALFDTDRATLLNRVVIQAIREFHLDLSELHNDSTTITFTGEYPEADGRWMRGKPTVALRRSLSNKDHRPDLKQVLWNLTVTFDGAVPVRCQVHDGNTEDSTTHIGNWDALCLLVGSPNFLYVADCKLCTEGAMLHIHGKGGRFLTVVPDTRKETEWFREHLKEHAVVWVDVPRESGEEKGEVPVLWRTTEAPLKSKEGFRIVWVWSWEKQVRDLAWRQAAILRATKHLEALEKRLQSSRCRIHAREGVVQAAEQAMGSAGRWLEYGIQEEAVPQFTQERRGRPGKNTRYRRKDRVRYHVSWKLKDGVVAGDARSDGMFPLITNDEKLTGAELLKRYKAQARVEKRHEQLKTVYRVAPIFLKKATRIEALLGLYFLALLVQALIEREVRRGMARENLVGLPLYPEKRLAKAPTTNRMLEVLGPVMVSHLREKGKHVRNFLTELTPLQKDILRLAGVPEETYTRYA